MNRNNFRIHFLYTLYVIILIMLYPIITCFFVITSLFKTSKVKCIAGEVAVVTGAAQGLGKEIAVELAKRGCHIAVVDINENLAKKTANLISKTYKVNTMAYKVDVSNYRQLLKLNSDISNDLGNVTILINNAGIIFLSDISQPLPEEIQQLVNVNITSHLWINQIFLPKMKELNCGYIVAVSSLAALFPIPLLKFYAPTKSALRSYMSSLRMQLKSEKSNIQISTIMPTFLTTNQATKDIMTTIGLSKLYPLMDGQVVAKQIVDCMLQGVEELTIPRIASVGYKLMEILPSEIRDQLWLILDGNKWETVSNTTDIAKILLNSKKQEALL